MSGADKDGRMAEWVGDLHACLSMEVQESLREAAERLRELASGDDPPPDLPSRP